MKTLNLHESNGEDIVHRLEREKRERKFVKEERKRRKKRGDKTPFYWC